MNPKTLALLIIISSMMLALPALAAYGNRTCGNGTDNTTSVGNITFNFTVNGSLFCNATAGEWFNITNVNTDNNYSKNFSFDGTSNWSMSLRFIINNTDNSTNYSVKIFNATAVGNITHNVTTKSSGTGTIQFNMTLFNNTGYINFTKLPGAGAERSSLYVYTVAFAVLVGAGAAIYHRRIRKV